MGKTVESKQRQLILSRYFKMGYCLRLAKIRVENRICGIQ